MTHEATQRTTLLFCILVGGSSLLAIAGCGGKSGSRTVDNDQSEKKDAANESPFSFAPESPKRADQRSSHQRMLDELDFIKASTDVQIDWLGSGKVRKAREDLAALPDNAPLPKRYQLMLEAAKLELRIGNEDDAIKVLKAAEQLLKTGNAPVEQLTSLKAELDFQLGVAFLRQAETDNCCSFHNADSCIVPIQGEGIHTRTDGSAKAIERFRRVLEATTPESMEWLRAAWLLNIAHMTLGQYPDQVPERWRVPTSAFSTGEGFGPFRNVSKDRGCDTFSLSGGVVAEDFDRDGDLDLMVSSMETNSYGQIRLFLNDGAANFQEHTEQAGLQGLLGGLNLIHDDFDNDGFFDVYVLRGGWFQNNGRHPNSLLHNNGDGTFTDVAYDAGVTGDSPTQTADWGDYDRDGDVDLYVGNEHNRSCRAPSQLFRNNGDGTFDEVAAAAGVDNQRFAKSIVWGDYDNDGWLDLYVSNYGEPNRLFHNNQDGTFTDLAEQLRVDEPIWSFPAWFWDVNNDGHVDLFVAAYANDAAFVAAEHFGVKLEPPLPRLYLGDGKGFKEVGDDYRIRTCAAPMGANFGDLDNDGWLDFYIGTGEPEYSNLMPNRMFRNLAGDKFVEVTNAGRFGHLQKGHGIVFADLDQDGDLDIFEQMGGAYPGDRYYDALFENPGHGRHFFEVRLIGLDSSRTALGAKLTLTCVDKNGSERTLYRTVGTGASFGSNPLAVWFGLDKAERILNANIRWPNGSEQAIPQERLQLNQSIVLFQP